MTFPASGTVSAARYRASPATAAQSGSPSQTATHSLPLTQTATTTHRRTYPSTRITRSPWTFGRTARPCGSPTMAPPPDTLFAYDVSSGVRQPDKELVSVNIHPTQGNLTQSSFWSNDEIMWVSDSGDDKAFAYLLSDGSRQQGRDIDFVDENITSNAIWSDGGTLWVADGYIAQLFAYRLSDGEPIPDLRGTSISHVSSVGASTTTDIWAGTKPSTSPTIRTTTSLPTTSPLPHQPAERKRRRREVFSVLGQPKQARDRQLPVPGQQRPTAHVGPRLDQHTQEQPKHQGVRRPRPHQQRGASSRGSYCRRR